MRRIVASLVLSMVWVVATPRPAEAWFWKWLDDLSGPQFQGFSLDVRFGCLPQGKGARLEMLRGVKQRVQSEQLRYQHQALSSDPPAAFLNGVASLISAAAVAEVQAAIDLSLNRGTSLDAEQRMLVDALRDKTHGTVPKEADQVDRHLWTVTQLRILARMASDGRIEPDSRDERFELYRQWLSDLQAEAARAGAQGLLSTLGNARIVTGVSGLVQQLREAHDQAGNGTLKTEKQQDKGPTAVRSLAATPAATVAICGFRYYDVDRFFVAAAGGYGWDTKPENRDKDFKLVTAQVSAHYTVVPAITVGAGFGHAWFLMRSDVGSTVRRWYPQVMLDLKPLTLFNGDPRFRSPWAHTLYVRYGLARFSGFEAGAFGPDQRDPYPEEYINTLSVYFDAEPLFRNWRGKWWKDKP